MSTKIKNLAFFGLALLSVSALVFATNPRVSAIIRPVKDVEVDLDISSVLDLQSDTSENVISITPSSAGVFRTSVVNLTATTNNPTGCSVTLSSTTSQTSLFHSNDNTYFIPTLDGNYTASAFPINYWGYSTDATNYKPVSPLSSPTPIYTSTGPVVETFPVTFGAKADLSQAAGTYTGTVIFTISANYTTDYTYTINYHTNGGSGGPVIQTSTSPLHSHTFVVPDEIPYFYGSGSGYVYEFLGWSTSSSAADGNDAYDPGNSITLTYEHPTLDLYAVWSSTLIHETTNPSNRSGFVSSYVSPLGVTVDNLSLLGSSANSINKTTSVAAFEYMVSSLPDASEITMANRAAILRAQAAYEALTDEEKSAIDPEILAKYNAIIAAYYDLLNSSSSADPLLIAAAAVSVAAIGAGVYVLAKKDEEDK